LAQPGELEETKKAFATDRPAIALIGIEMNMGLINVDPQRALMQCIVQQTLERFDEGSACFRFYLIQQLASFLPGKAEPSEQLVQQSTVQQLAASVRYLLSTLTFGLRIRGLYPE
jgi:hypothetical protein